MLISIRLEDAMAHKLQKLSAQTHRSKSHYIREAIKHYMHDQEDYLLALAEYEKKGPRTSLAKVRKELDLED